MKRKILIFILLLPAIALMAANSTLYVEVGDEFTVTSTYHSNTLSIVWHWDIQYLEAVNVSSYSSTATFRAKRSLSTPVVIQANTTYMVGDRSTESYDSWSVFISDNTPSATLSISPSIVSLTPGETTTVSAICTSPYSGNYIWGTDNVPVATVVGNGSNATIRGGNTEGTAIITVYLDNGLSAACRVYLTHPTIAVTSISLPESDTVLIGKEYYMSPNKRPVDATSELYWSSSNPTVATVRDGYIKALAVGSTIISVTTDNGLSSSCNLTVVSVDAICVEMENDIKYYYLLASRPKLSYQDNYLCIDGELISVQHDASLVRKVYFCTKPNTSSINNNPLNSELSYSFCDGGILIDSSVQSSPVYVYSVTGKLMYTTLTDADGFAYINMYSFPKGVYVIYNMNHSIKFINK